MQFQYYSPTRIYFGCGELEKSGPAIAALGRRALIVTGRSAAKRLGYASRLSGLLETAGMETALFSGISPNPRVEEVDQAVREFAAWKPDAVVALGGGSAMDAAKAVALGLTTGESVSDYLAGQKEITHVDVPLAAVPTTAGTGSEVDRAAILTDEARGIKTSFRHDGFFPRLAIVDPLLTLSLPPRPTRECGFDVLSHAIETYLSRAGGDNPLVESQSLTAIQLVAENLPRVLADGQDIDARTSLLYASMLMGFNLANSTTCLPHRLQYPIGVRTDTSHGAGLIVLFRSWLEQTYEFSPEKFSRVAAAMGIDGGSKAAFLAGYDRFAAAAGLCFRLLDFGLQAEDIPSLAAAVTGSLGNDPAGNQPGIVEAIYRGAL